MTAGPRPDAYFGQLQKAEREAAGALVRDPVFMQNFERAVHVAHICLEFTEKGNDPPAEFFGRLEDAVREAIAAARTAAPPFAGLFGEFLPRQIEALVVYHVHVERGDPELAAELYKELAPMRRHGPLPDLRAFRKAIGIVKQPEGRTPRPPDAEALARRLQSAFRNLAREQLDVTEEIVATDFGSDVKRLRERVRQAGLGELFDLVQNERVRRKLKPRGKRL